MLIMVIRLPISCISLMVCAFHEPSVLLANGMKICEVLESLCMMFLTISALSATALDLEVGMSEDDRNFDITCHWLATRPWYYYGALWLFFFGLCKAIRFFASWYLIFPHRHSQAVVEQRMANVPWCTLPERQAIMSSGVFVGL